MKSRDLVLGALALALLVGGILLSRHLTSSSIAPAAGQELDLSLQDGELVVDDLRVAIAIEPRPAQPMKPMQLALAFRRGQQPVVVEAPRLSFNMVMDMGPHDYALTGGPGERWVATDVVLPTCPSGGRLWFGSLHYGLDGQQHQARFRLELQPPVEATGAPAATTRAATDAGPEDAA